jgi:hypothetical protein
MLPNKLQEILNQARQDPAVCRLAERMAEGLGQPVNIFGPSDTQKIVLALALADSAGKRPCFLVPDELRARAGRRPRCPA